MANIIQYGKEAVERLATATRSGMLAAADFVKLQKLLYDSDGNIVLTGTSGATGGFVGRETRLGGPQQDVHLRSGTATGSYAFVEANNAAFLAQNCYWDGTNWQRYDTSQQALIFYLGGGGGGWAYGYTAAGANPIAAFTTYTLGLTALDGLLGLGTVLSSSRSTNLAVASSTNTTLQSLTLTPGKWLVEGRSYIGTPGVAPATVDLWLNGYTATAMLYLTSLTGGSTGLTPAAVVSVATGTTVPVDLTARGTTTFTSYGTGGAAGFGNATGIHATRIG